MCIRDRCGLGDIKDIGPLKKTCMSLSTVSFCCGGSADNTSEEYGSVLFLPDPNVPVVFSDVSLLEQNAQVLNKHCC